MHLPPPLPPAHFRNNNPTLSYSELHLKLLERAAPPSVLVDTNYEIVHLSEHAGQFLRLVGGDASMNLLAMVDPSLRTELRVALFRAVQSGEDINVPPISMEIDGRLRRLSVRVQPMREEERQSDLSNFILVIFEEAAPTESQTNDGTTSSPPLSDQSEVVRSLEAELEHLRSYLRASVEQYETSSEELKASNEELQALNEEQRSATEELETSREEIQAGNEELTTVNSELKAKIDELGRANSDLQNLMSSTDIATVFLNRNLHIKRYTPPAVALFHFIPTDTGRPLADLKHDFNDESFIDDAIQVLQTLAPLSREIAAHDGRCFLLRISPYRTVEDYIDGVVLTFIDITERRQAEAAVIQSEQRLRIAIEAGELATWDWNVERDEIIWNERHFLLLGMVPRDGVVRVKDFSSHLHPDDYAVVMERLNAAVENATSFEAEFRIVREDTGEVRWMNGHGRTTETRTGRATRIVGVMFDSTERHKAQEILQRAHEDLEHLVAQRTHELSLTLEQQRLAEAGRTELMRRIVNTQEEERGRISRELHDNLGQHLTAVMLGLQALESRVDSLVDNEQKSHISELSHLRTLVDGLMRAAHDQARQLRPAELDAMGLEAALKQYIHDWSERTEVDVDFQAISWDERLASEIETTLYRVVQEALTNIARHAQATLVSVIIEQGDEGASAIIEDNGHGFSAEQTTTRLGLLGMKERLALVGGTLDIESTLDEGTTVFARVPDS